MSHAGSPHSLTGHMKKITATIASLILLAGMSAWTVAEQPPVKEQPAPKPNEARNAAIFDSFGGKNGERIDGRTPDKANAPGGKWSIVGNANPSVKASKRPDEYNIPMMELTGGAIAIPISSQGSYTKPKQFTISAEIMGVIGTPRVGLGFYSALPARPDKKAGTKGDIESKNFTGLIMLASGSGDDGALTLFQNGKEKQRVKYTGKFDPNELHRLSYDVDTTSGAISNVRLTGSSSDYSAFNSTAFTDAATAYAAVGWVRVLPGDYFIRLCKVHNFAFGEKLVPPPLPTPVNTTWIPAKPGLWSAIRPSIISPRPASGKTLRATATTPSDRSPKRASNSSQRQLPTARRPWKLS
jgi:hypothetical protein